MKINNKVILSYLDCPFKAGLILRNHSAYPTDYQALMADLADRYRPRAQAAISRGASNIVTTPDVAEIHSLLENGTALILDVTIETADFEFHFDALKRCFPGTQLPPQYEPVIFLHGDTVSASQQLLVAFGGYVLYLAEGNYPTAGIIVHGPKCSLYRVPLASKYRTVEMLGATLAKIANTNPEIPLTLNNNCGKCEFQSRCFTEAKKQDNLTLLKRMTDKTLKQYARKGIFTLTQLSYTFHPRRQSKRAKARGRPHSFALQALAIREQKIYILAPPALPPAEIRLFVDMEGTPDGSFVYLIGLHVQQGDREQSYSFWANNREEEKGMFELFIQTLSQFPIGQVFHYGPYETRVIKRIVLVLGPKVANSLISRRPINVLSALYAKIYFPTYSNSLKEVAGSLGYVWQAPTPSGLQTVVWRHQWEETYDPVLKSTLLRYNRDDCLALKLLTTFLYDIDGQSPSLYVPGSRPEVVSVESLANHTEQGNDIWGKKNFAVADFESITRSAYFEYQRSKIFVRTNRNFRSIQRRQKRQEKKTAIRVNRTVSCRAVTCIFCKGHNLSINSQFLQHAKLSLDLRISRAGIARVAVRYRCHWYRCLSCGRSFLPPSFTKKERFGHTLASWAIYQHVANRVTFENIATTAKECFSLPIDFHRVYDFKARFAQYYRSTYKTLIKKLISGSLLHADETTMNLKKGKCYVWVFTNMEEVVFVYRPDRNASFLHELLQEFRGVLVTDFFTGYDSVKCPQQKCLVHLIRDLNDGLLANPFDEALKSLCTQFGQMMRKIIGTIDQFGLKAKYLKKHKDEVACFFEAVAGRVYESEAARTLAKRMVKYQRELFTFLDYDGIPWNNNNAEHAIKHFAKYRRLVNGRVTQSGLEDYLTLLSLYETCRYKEISFLEFLSSKRRDIDQFAVTK